jgi:hypothetical protein
MFHEALRETLARAKDELMYDVNLNPVHHVTHWCEQKFPLPIMVACSHFHFSTHVSTAVGHVAEQGRNAHGGAQPVVLASTASAHATFFGNIIALLRRDNCQRMAHSVELEAMVMLVASEHEQLKMLAQNRNDAWHEVVHRWEQTFRFVDRPHSEFDLHAKLGHVMIPCGLELVSPYANQPLLMITPATERCMFALAHVMQFHSVIAPCSTQKADKPFSMVKGLAHLLMRCFWHFQCDITTNITTILCFLNGITATNLNAWGVLAGTLALPRPILSTLMVELQQRHALRSISTTLAEKTTFSFCNLQEQATWAIILPFHGPSVPASLTRWLGHPLRPIAMPLPHRALLLQALLYAQGVSETV